MEKGEEREVEKMERTEIKVDGTGRKFVDSGETRRNERGRMIRKGKGGRKGKLKRWRERRKKRKGQ